MVKRWGRRAAAVLVGLGVLWLLAALALPPLLKWQLQERGSALLGRSLRVGEVRFAPWSLRLTLADVALGGAAPADEPQLRIARVLLDLQAASLWQRAPVLSAVEVEAPQARLRRHADGRLDIDDLLARLQAGPRPPAPPPRFALHNLRLSGGALRFEDEGRGVRHELTGLELALPFLSSLPADVDTQVQPRLAFTLDGSRFDSGAQSTPFSKDRDSMLTLRLEALDLRRLAPYLPAALQLQQGTLGTQLALRFRLPGDGPPQLDVQGALQLRDLALADAQGRPMAGCTALDLELQPSQPLARRLALGAVRLDGCRLEAGRDAQGRLRPALAADGPARPAAPTGATEAPAAPWQVSVQSLAVQGTRLRWQDDALGQRWRVEALEASARGLRWPLGEAAPFEASARLVADAAAATPGAPLTLRGEVAAAGGHLGFELRGLPLAPLGPLLASVTLLRPEGLLGGQGELRWTPAGLQQLTLAQLRLDGVRAAEPGARGAAPALGWDALTLEGVRVALPRREVEIGALRLQAPALQLARDAQGRLNAAAWGASAPSAAAPPEGRVTRTAALRPGGRTGGAPPPGGGRGDGTGGGGDWQVRLHRLELADARVAWQDAQAARRDGRPLRLEASQLQLALQELAWPLARGAQPGSLSLQLRDPDARTAPVGRVEWRGTVQPQPLQLGGRWRIERVPLHRLAAYAADALPPGLLLRRAEGGFEGELSLRLDAAPAAGGASVQARGNVLLGGVRVAARGAGDAGDDLLGWQSLELQGLDVALQPGGRPRVQVQAVTLADLDARLLLTEQGRLNLQDLRGRPVQAGAAAAAAASAADGADAGATDALPRATHALALPLELSLGTTTLVNGHVNFTDRFIRPNYSADLTELNGTLGPLRSDAPAMAPLSLRGRAAGSAQLEIQGQLNPLLSPPALELRARATGLELPPLSPYTGKYAGYAIERGKLSADLAYRVDEDGRLQASNRVTLNQLTFGERVDSPSATKLPVLLAVSLLKDRDGNIDLELPVSGSLNDPQFSIGGVVLRLIGNVLLKALTSPFSLLAGLHGPDLSQVAFEPGSARLLPAAHDVLERAAKALADKPALQTTLTGEADPLGEAEAMRRAQLESRIADEQRRLALREGRGVQAGPPAPPTPEQREALLRRVYADTPLPDKPRNVVGLARTLPAPEVEQRLLAAIVVTPETARALAVQRAVAVRDALQAQGVAGERLFVAAPRLHDAAVPGAWAPRVELSLR